MTDHFREVYVTATLRYLVITLGGLIYGMATDLGSLPLWAKISIIGVTGIIASTVFVAIAFSRVAGYPRRRR